MPELGGLYNLADVQNLVLYLLDISTMELTKQNIIEISLYDGLVEYFDVTEALNELLKKGLIDIISLEKDQTYKITDYGRQTHENRPSLPYNIRKKANAALAMIISRIEHQNDVVATYKEVCGGYEVCCTLNENDIVLFEYKLFVPTKMSAHIVCQQFKENPIKKYQDMMEYIIDKDMFNKEK